MTLGTILANHLREVYFGKNWTWVNLQETLKDVTHQQALTKVKDLNTIVGLTYHLHYYVRGQMKVLKGGPLEIKDEFSFNHPEINSERDWQEFLSTLYNELEEYAQRVETLSNEQLEHTFVEEKYGTYYRNIQGAVEHAHYHLGQIVLIKKLLSSKNTLNINWL